MRKLGKVAKDEADVFRPFRFVADALGNELQLLRNFLRQIAKIVGARED
jgi:hypothetical protein